MHDPMTLICDITLPFTGKRYPPKPGEKKGMWKRYPYTLASLWHVDPESNGSDDSCGWFMRANNGDPVILRKIEQEFLSTLAEQKRHRDVTFLSFTLSLYHRALYVIFGDWKKVNKYIDKHFHEIVFFSNNSTDSLDHNISNFLLDESGRTHHTYFASVIYGDILRNLRPWYKHPRWHIQHWKLSIVPLQQLKRSLFSKCEYCGKGFRFGDTNIVSHSWSAPGPQWFKSERSLYHMDCSHKSGISKTPNLEKSAGVE